jgi:hypothetical protein
MKQIILFVKEYFYELDKKWFTLTTLFTAGLIFLNYFLKVDAGINRQENISVKFFSRWGIFLFALLLPWLFCVWVKRKNYFRHRLFVFLIVLASALFALKTVIPLSFTISADEVQNDFWNRILFWPAQLLMMMLVLLFIWKRYYHEDSFFGMTTKNFSWKPYLLMLLIMAPLIAVASTRPEFRDTYPVLKEITEGMNEINIFHVILSELSYGSDFISIELFFRGFLILAFVKWAGNDAILPMACFYCVIHFGKPLAECISSYFGGIILGIVVYHTRSIYGGLVVHLGIAWLMEVGGYTGNVLLR